ncbi:hypothetical protein BO221_23140 [Archangium sp. Cb G35]|uniref:hypothetical protein n=1 Tax=Archangium sp. Cb G35 TaxID=1920190 RepID=UPI0009622924|nr:hypothetical protein [Archangium sp. Cb G35]OJT22656.1 hypothetical protein BO221_23140 [Archangium sp. Cb G35]
MSSATRYLFYTAKVKHGQLPRYLHAAQLRKRFLEKYQIRRQVKASALTGDPDRLFEVYYVENVFRFDEAMEDMKNDSRMRDLERVLEDARITSKERKFRRQSRLPYNDKEELTQLPYMLNGLGQAQCAQLVATKPYLLHVVCTLHDINYLDEFNEHMPALLDNFEQYGLSLVVAGQYKSKNRETTLLNIWEYEDPESPRKLMPQLAENLTYAQIDLLCDQDQHVCRNVSRHYQLYPLLEPKVRADVNFFL